MIHDIERAVELVRLFNEKKHTEFDSSLIQSLDLLKVYSLATPEMQKGTEKERQLAQKILETVKAYNALVKKAKEPPATISGIIKELFDKVSRKEKEQPQHEIFLPIHKEYSSGTSAKIHGIALAVQQKQVELDLFRLKAITLTQEQTEVPLPLKEALELIQKSPIATTEVVGSVSHLEQTLTPLPGVDITIRGSFAHDPKHPELVWPVKPSFSLSCSITQTGFSTPLQHIGFGLDEKLFPSSLLRPEMCPTVAQFLQKKRQLAEALVPYGRLYNKAKALIAKKRAIFSQNEPLYSLVGKIVGHDVDTISYDDLSNSSFVFCNKAISCPISCLQDEWLFKKNSALFQNPALFCKKFLEDKVLEAAVNPPAPFTSNDIVRFGNAASTLHIMQLSEHLNFEPPALTAFEESLLVALFNQQLIFGYELEEVDIDQLEAHLYKVLTSKPMPLATALAQELIQYYAVRFETLL